MQKAIGISCAVVISLFSAGVALADEGGNRGVGVGASGVVQNRESNLEFRADASIKNSNRNDEGDEDEVGTSSRERGFDDAAGSPETRGKKEGLLKRFGTTTPPGFFNEERRDKNERATSTEDRGDDRDRGDMRKGGVREFFSWLLGLPATTTVGDIRAQLAATTTASTTAEVPPRGVAGFFQHFLEGIAGFFGRGRGD